jgi:hypothetical protein
MNVQFEPGWQILPLETGTFSLGNALRLIWIPASAEFIAEHCFIREADKSHLYLLYSSPLREIESGAVAGYRSLRGLCIPASAQTMTADSLPIFGNCQIELEKANRHLDQKDDLLADLDHRYLVSYCGTGSNIVIPNEIEQIDVSCLRWCESFQFVTFLQVPPRSAIATWAFGQCSALKTITIPSSATRLAANCFDCCDSLRAVPCCPGSKLARIGDSVFGSCRTFASIILAASCKI